MDYLNLLEARDVYNRGENVTEHLRKKFKKTNTSEIIEIAYDLQAGSYIKRFNSNPEKAELYVSQVAKILSEFVHKTDSLLDVGTGELTTLTLVLNKMITTPKNVLAFDISWSRLIRGRQFFKSKNSKKKFEISTFVADIKYIPLHSNCIDVITSSHSLEPNGENLIKLIKELFRVVKKKIILFEPSYEFSSKEGKRRMDKLGYIRGIPNIVEKLGGKVTEIIPIDDNKGNPLNPTACYIIEPLKFKEKQENRVPILCVPGTDFKLEYENGFFNSKDTGLVYPILEDIPILKNKYGILATAKF